eukprot:m.38805 g.38805  ORF g.38805 m.38805 type:complete len:99 (-) comp13509_c0_seq1:74-370(-)
METPSSASSIPDMTQYHQLEVKLLIRLMSTVTACFFDLVFTLLPWLPWPPAQPCSPPLLSVAHALEWVGAMAGWSSHRGCAEWAKPHNVSNQCWSSLS